MVHDLELTVAYNTVLQRIDAVYGDLTPEKHIRRPHVVGDVTTEATIAVGYFLLNNGLSMVFMDNEGKKHIIKVEDYVEDNPDRTKED